MVLESDQGAALRLTGIKETSRPASSPAAPLSEDEIRQRIRSQLFYLWRDRSGCSAIRIAVPESPVGQTAILTSASCIAGNPLSRSRTVLTPKFVLTDLAKAEGLRNSEFLREYFFSQENRMSTDDLVAERVTPPAGQIQESVLFSNEDRMTALYHEEWGKEAWLPARGIVHRDYLALMKPLKVGKNEGFGILLRQNDLALMQDKLEDKVNGLDGTATSNPSETRRPKIRGLEIRGKPVPQEGDRFFVGAMLRDNEQRVLDFRIRPTKVLGFSPKYGLIQTCEPALKTSEEYFSDRSAVLVIQRGDQTVLVGIASFGSPTVQEVGDEKCVVTTFTHLERFRGWIKIAHAELERQSQSPAPSSK